MKPHLDFFVIGPARCGTTSIHRALIRHPGIFASPIKEPRFFDTNWKKGWEWYAQHYAGAEPGLLCGDFSPTYANAATDTPARRIAHNYPGAKIVQAIRNPIDCAISNWRMAAQVRKSIIPFEQALSDWANVVLDRALFYRQIERYRSYFPDEQIRSVPLVERSKDPGLLTEIQNFLGLEPVSMKFPHRNLSDRPERPGKPLVPMDVRRRFIDVVAEDAARMLEYAGLPAKFWDLSETYAGWS